MALNVALVASRTGLWSKYAHVWRGSPPPQVPFPVKYSLKLLLVQLEDCIQISTFIQSRTRQDLCSKPVFKQNMFCLDLCSKPVFKQNMTILL